MRRAFRYADVSARLALTASAVQPDVRVETQETLSLGEERSVLASQLQVHIVRAGLFQLSFVLPRDFEVESLTGQALSHWTELKSNVVVAPGAPEASMTRSTPSGPTAARTVAARASRVVLIA